MGPASGPPPRFGLRFLVIGIVVAAIVVGAASLSPRALTGSDELSTTPLAIIGVLCVLTLAASRRTLGVMAKQAAIWLTLGLVLIVGYSFRDDLQPILGRIMGTVVPSRGVEVAPGLMRYSADEAGQFHIDAMVDGAGVHFLVDTGASGIALSQHDAGRIGLQPSDFHYTGRFATANGTVRAAPIVLDKLIIGALVKTSVPAWVNEGDLDESLLGMSYLSTLGRIEIQGDSLTVETGGP